MSTPHINAKEGDFAKVVLMPGDPLRAKWIAENFLTDAKLVTSVRNVLGFTGYTKNGKRITVMASGMGMPSIGIYSHELFSFYGVETIIRIGTAGSYQKEIKPMDVLICATASTDSAWQKQFDLGGTLSAGADFNLVASAVEAAKNQKIPYHVGNILSADVFYNYNSERWKIWAKLGIMGVEMESYALFVNAMILKKRALAIFTVSDSFITGESLSSEKRQTGLVNMINVAIETAEKVA